jgi:MoaA/NifB/PqqE/SkfB family radical SAM enzyme
MPDNDLFPKELILEVTNFCNLRCRHCHFHARKELRRRDLGFMEPDIWKRVLEELQDLSSPVTLMTHGAGEPLLHKHIFEILEVAKKNPMLSVGFMCNGMLLDKKSVDRLIDLQIDFIAFSVDGVNPHTHDHFRINANLSQIEANINYLVEKKASLKSSVPVLHFNMVEYPEILDQSMDYVRKWLPVSGAVNIATFRPIGSRKLWNGDHGPDFKPCPLLWNQMVVAHDGNVGLCCEDINIDVNLGNVSRMSLNEIFNQSPKLNYIRKKHMEGILKGLDLCCACHSWSGDMILKEEEIIIDKMRIKKRTTPAFTTYTRV